MSDEKMEGDVEFRELVVRVGRQGVQFGKNYWVSHERITDCPADRIPKMHPEYMDWINAAESWHSARVRGLVKALVKAAIPLEALNMSGGIAPKAMKGIEEAVTEIREVLSAYREGEGKSND